MSDVARVLEVLRDAAARGDDLVVALRDCGLPGAHAAAERLATGASLPQAVAGLVPPLLAVLLAGGIPPLATVAALLADEAWRQAERRRLMVDHLAYPLASMAMIAAMAAILARVVPQGPWYGPLASSAWALPPALLALLLMAAPWLPRAWKLPGSGWAAQLDQAGRWARAALAVRWRLTEAQALRLLGADLEGLAAVLGAPDAERHCRLLADWHRQAARRRLLVTAVMAAGLVLAAGGGVVLGAARMWTAAAV
jgi:hypothetical protein